MKKAFIAVILSAIFFATGSAQSTKQCDPASESQFKSFSKPNGAGGYGAIITKDKAVTLNDLEKNMTAQKVTQLKNVKISGKVHSVCKVKGCWVEVADGNGGNMRMRFKDYSFFVPRDCEGQMIYAQGTARFDTTSVAMLQHYAEDAGKSKAEVASITKPEVALTFEAEGVLFDKK